MHSPALDELIDITSLRARLDQFAVATGFSVTLFGHRTETPMVQSGHRALGDVFDCANLSDLIGASDLGQDSYLLCRCGHQLVHAVARIMVDGAHLGTLAMGRVLTAPPDLAVFSEQATALGVDHEAYLEAVSRVPIVSEERLGASLLFVLDVISDLVEQSQKRQLAEQRAKTQERAVAELRQLQHSLDQSQGQLRTLVDTLPELIWLKDLDGVYLACNRRFELFFGATEAEIVGKTDYDFVDRELADFFRENDRAAMQANGPRRNEEEISFASDGHRELLETIKTPMRDTDGRVIGVLGIGRDITERRRSEEERETLRNELADARHMESVGRLAGGVAHDFNNLLAPILAYAQLLLDETEEGTQGFQDLRQIYFAADRARDLVQQLLAYGGKQPLSVRHTDINQVVRAFTTLIRGSVPETIEIVHDMGEDLQDVGVDPPRVEQVLMNLVLNGASAMPKGGTLTVQTEATRVGPSSSWDVQPGDYVQLSVSDTGSGISPEIAKHIFEPFYTTKESRGHGLGLATVFGIAKQHGGDVRVDNQPKHGAIFRVLLPVVRSPSVVDERPLKIENTPLTGSECLLLVEDEEQVRTLAHRMLTQMGYSVALASDGREALAVLTQKRDQIDLVLTDVVMPEMNGPELAAQVRSTWPDLRVLFMTGYSNDLLADHGVSSQQQHQVILKPFTSGELLSVIRGALDEAPS